VNRILLESDEISDGVAVLRGRRARHLLDVIDAVAGDEVRVGIFDGLLGTARVTDRGSDTVTLAVEICDPPPAPLPITLILALPRPKVARRILIDAAASGIKSIHLIGAWTVDKSYWSSPLLSDSAIREHLVLGLEQGGDSIRPTVECHRLFKPFIEDRLPDMIEGKQCLIAHPGASADCPRAVEGEVALAVGPERGFTQYEIDRFAEAGFAKASLGTRTLRVESALAMLLGRIG
jgi:16S rRNA (uracil1498-N3)-methyltransferase